MTAETTFLHLTLLQDLPREQAAQVRSVFVPVIRAAQEQLFDQGEPAEYVYIVAEGEVQIWYKPDDGQRILLARVRQNGVVGWSTVLGNPAYTSSACCATDCVLLRASGRDLRQLCEQHPQTGRAVLVRLARMVAERLQITHQNVLSLIEQGMRISLPSPSAESPGGNTGRDGCSGV